MCRQVGLPEDPAGSILAACKRRPRQAHSRGAYSRICSTCDRRHGDRRVEEIVSAALIGEQTMHLRIRFIGKALEYLNGQGYDDRCLTVQVSPELVHVGDLIRHPLFPGRSVYVVAREIDLVYRCLSVWVDELPF